MPLFQIGQVVVITDGHLKGEEPITTENTFGKVTKREAIRGQFYYTVQLLDGSEIAGTPDAMGMVALPTFLENGYMIESSWPR